MTWLTPPQVAHRYGVKPETVRAWITGGLLFGKDMSAHPGVGRPRWKISEAELTAFEHRRSVSTPTNGAPRRRKKDESVIEFFV